MLQQHFVGWFVKTKTDCFDDSIATFMDFNIPQNGNTRFMYVLPLGPNKALLEYTLFSQNALQRKEYSDAIADFLKNLPTGGYKILEESGKVFLETNKHTELKLSTAQSILKDKTIGDVRLMILQ